ncbi:hypothetical protein cand_016900 [Cryptosporidium andersoni]|uniref:Ribophorin-2 n=1 Tax=Cryptosporidium andersoni TaxID=117008 RepID=A0A1J4MTG2_9CRYT|nr:hypothetical protein cand_016900 [Cryptosporidium andersoni]
MRFDITIFLLVCFPLLIFGQLLSPIQTITNDHEDSITNCGKFLLNIVQRNSQQGPDISAMCDFFRIKVLTPDTNARELHCSIIGSSIINCDLRNFIGDANLLRKFFTESDTSISTVYYILGILQKLPNEIALVLGKEDIIEDSTDILNNILKGYKKYTENLDSTSKNNYFRMDKMAYAFAVADQLLSYDVRNSLYVKLFVKYLEGDILHSIDNFEDYIFSTSLFLRSYFSLVTYPKEPMDIPLPINTMIYNLGIIGIQNINNNLVLSELLLTTHILSRKGIFYIQGFFHNKNLHFMFCLINGEPMKDLHISIVGAKLEVVRKANTCEYELQISNEDERDIIIEKILNKEIKIEVSSKLLKLQQLSIPIVNYNKSNFDNVKISKIQVSTSNFINISKSNLDIKYMKNDSLRPYSFIIKALLSSDIKMEALLMYQHLMAIKIEALEPIKIGTPKTKIYPMMFTNKYQAIIDISKDNFLCTSRNFQVSLVYGSLSSEIGGTLSESKFKHLFNLDIEDSSNTEFLNKHCNFSIHPEMIDLYTKPEIKYNFSEPKKVPGILLPLITSLSMVLFAIFFLFSKWRRLIKELNIENKLTLRINFTAILSIVFLVLSILIVVLYWLSLDIFQFSYTFIPSIVSFLVLFKISLNNSDFMAL